MGTFPKELDKWFGRRMKELGRSLSSEEGEILEAELFKSWVEAERYDELILRIHAIYDRAGGREECIILCHALQEDRDIERIDTLFCGLVKRWVKAFWANWEQAQSGHPGHMHGCAKQAADVMEVYLEHYIRVANLGLEERMLALRQEMLAFQARERGTMRTKASGPSFKPKPLRGSA